jgi:hypothetical protein
MPSFVMALFQYNTILIAYIGKQGVVTGLCASSGKAAPAFRCKGNGAAHSWCNVKSEFCLSHKQAGRFSA